MIESLEHWPSAKYFQVALDREVLAQIDIPYLTQYFNNKRITHYSDKVFEYNGKTIDAFYITTDTVEYLYIPWSQQLSDTDIAILKSEFQARYITVLHLPYAYRPN